MLAAILAALEVNIDLFRAGNQARCLEKWRQFSATLGNMVTVRGVSETYTGLARDINAEGALVVVLEDGQEKVLTAGDVTIRDR